MLEYKHICGKINQGDAIPEQPLLEEDSGSEDESDLSIELLEFAAW